MEKKVCVAVGVCCLAAALVAGEHRGASSDGVDYERAAWKHVKFKAMDAEPLRRRMADVPEKLLRHPAAVAVVALSPDRLVTEVRVAFNSAENPSRADVTVEERGFLDDDLIAVRHVIAMQRGKSGGWMLRSYQSGRCTREHLGRAGHPLFRDE